MKHGARARARARWNSSGVMAEEVQHPGLLYLLCLAGQPNVRLAIRDAHDAPRMRRQLGDGRRCAHRVNALELMIYQYLVQSKLVQEIKERRRRCHQQQLLLHESRQRSLIQLKHTVRWSLHQVHLYSGIDAAPTCSTAHICNWICTLIKSLNATRPKCSSILERILLKTVEI